MKVTDINEIMKFGVMMTPALVVDGEFAGEVERMLENDFAKSRLMDPGEYDAKPWWFRFAANLARLTSPVQ